MASNMSLEEKLDALMQSYQTVIAQNEEIKDHNNYLKKQLEQSERQKRRTRESPASSTPEDLSHHSEEVEGEPEPSRRTPRREWSIPPPNSNDFRIELPEFERKLDPDEFLDWLYTIERIFEYKEIPAESKVKLVALKLRKYASIWWTNLCAKRIRNRKEKIRTWEKMKTKLKARFLPSSYVQDRYAQLHSLTQDYMSVDEYTREFEKLLLKCDIHEPEEQTIVRYLGGLEPEYANVVELQQFTTFSEVCVLAHKVEQQQRRNISRQVYTKHPHREPVPQISPPPARKINPLG